MENAHEDDWEVCFFTGVTISMLCDSLNHIRKCEKCKKDLANLFETAKKEDIIYE